MYANTATFHDVSIEHDVALALNNTFAASCRFFAACGGQGHRRAMRGCGSIVGR